MDFCTKTAHNVDKRGDKHPRIKRFERDLLRLSAQERRAIDALMRQTAGLRKKTDRAAMTKKGSLHGKRLRPDKRPAHQ